MTKLLLFTFWVLFLAFCYWLTFPFLGTGIGKDVSGLLRGYTPTMAAVLTLLCTSKGKLSSYWKSCWAFKAPAKAYGLAVLLPLLINALVIVITQLIGDQPLLYNSLNIPRFVAIYFIFIVLDGPLGEELGWRGFFLPRLLSKYNPLLSSLIIGVVMFVWHLIIFAADGPELTSPFMVKYLISILGISMIFTYVYLKFSRLPVIAVLLHTSVNYFIFLRNSLIPAMTETSIDNVTYVVIVALLGVSLMLALQIQKRNEDRESESK